jgi:hypothetical protein
MTTSPAPQNNFRSLVGRWGGIAAILCAPLGGLGLLWKATDIAVRYKLETSLEAATRDANLVAAQIAADEATMPLSRKANRRGLAFNVVKNPAEGPVIRVTAAKFNPD